ncbi:hypothetical protein ACFQJ7_01740 [Halovenus rubra]|uniref:Uncharacterized protein n=2 Tax=Halovenus rubra TaxID=869890 RepID=A0ABD5X6D7_9EURY|nr:hypothetical protein [Halovenus rubra]
MTVTGVENSLLVFAVSLLVGGFGIHVGSKVALTSQEYSYAVVTALFGALAWALVEVLFSRVGLGGLLSSIIGLLVWTWVIRSRYSVGWTRATLLALGAWLGALFALAVLALFNIGNSTALGVPGI